MKNVILVAVFLLTAWVGQEVYAQQGFGTNTPDKSAAVDIQSSKRGLLIPRVALTETTSNVLGGSAGEITAPANSLFVYNTATVNDVTPGYYYWDRTDKVNPLNWAGKWVRFISADDVKTTKVMEGENVKVDSITNSTGTTAYTVSVKAGTADKQVLVTKETSPGSGEYESVWTDAADFVNDVILVGNGLEKDATDNDRVILGGALDRATTITTAGANTLAIDGLADVTSTFQADDDGYVMVMTAGGVLQKTKLSSLVAANNGLTVNDGSDNGGNDLGKVQLGGDLTKATSIGTDGTNTLAITGLEATAEANKIVVAADDDGVLQTVVRSLSGTITGTTTVATAVTGYNSYVQEVNLTAQLGGTDWTLTLPDAAAANNGQVINVKIINEDDSHTGYLNIIDNTGTLTYGSLPFQGWVLKSNGSKWLIVGRN